MMPARKSRAEPAAPQMDADIARRIWLAGVGAYGRVFEEAQGALGKRAGDAARAFDQLAARGEALEHIVRAKIAESEAGQKIAGVVEQISDFRAERRAALEARVGDVRKAVGETIAPFNPLALHRAVTELTERVEALEAARKPAAMAKRAPQKRAVKRAAKR